jgi:hypothetical protein
MYDDGEIESDLPPIKHSEVLSRVGFPSLALVEKRSRYVQKDDSTQNSSIPV